MSAASSTRPASPTGSAFTASESVTANNDDVLPTHHSKYYLHDEMSVFLVERKLFRVHRYFLARESDCLETMFGLPSGESNMVEGITDSSPIVLPGVTVQEFECLLDFFYGGMYYDVYDGSTDNEAVIRWTTLLSISTRLAFYKLRNRSIMELERLQHAIDPIERISLARTFDLPTWLKPAYMNLCQRKNPLEIWEAEKIGLTTTVLVARARDEVRRPPSSRGSSPDGWGGSSGGGGWGSLRVDPSMDVINEDKLSRVVQTIFWPLPPSSPDI